VAILLYLVKYVPSAEFVFPQGLLYAMSSPSKEGNYLGNLEKKSVPRSQSFYPHKKLQQIRF